MLGRWRNSRFIQAVLLAGQQIAVCRTAAERRRSTAPASAVRWAILGRRVRPGLWRTPGRSAANQARLAGQVSASPRPKRGAESIVVVHEPGPRSGRPEQSGGPSEPLEVIADMGANPSVVPVHVMPRARWRQDSRRSRLCSEPPTAAMVPTVGVRDRAGTGAASEPN